MPQIPGANESQVLNASSPVPIAAPEEARLLGNAVQHLGQGAFALGDALDTAAAKERDRHSKLSQQLALQQFREGSLELFAKHQAAARNAEDPTGYKSVGNFTADSHDLQKSITENLGLSGDAAAGFAALSGDNINDMGKELLAKRVAVNEKENDAIRSEVVAKRAAFAGLNPDKIPNLLAENELMVHNDPGQTPATMAGTIREMNANVILGAANDLKASKKFASAEAVVNKYGNLFDPKQKEKLIDDINTTRDKFNAGELVQLNLKEKRVEMMHKDIQNKTATLYTAQLQEAGNNELKRSAIVDDMNLAMLKGDLTEGQFKNLSEAKVFTRTQDSVYDSNVMVKLFEDSNYDKAIHKVQEDLKHGGVSAPKAEEMIVRINALKERERGDPTYHAAQKRAEQMLRDMTKDPMIMNLSDKAKTEMATKVAVSVKDLYTWISHNPKGDPEAHALYLLNNRFDARTQFPHGDSTAIDLNSIDEVRKAKEEVIKKGLFEMKNGGLSSDNEAKYKQQLATYNRIEKKLQMQMQYNKSKEFNVNSLLAPAPEQGRGPLRGR